MRFKPIEVALISHPGGYYYLLTHGRISRYCSDFINAQPVLQMDISADFAPGSSGAAVFNRRGEVTGIVSATNPLGHNMVIRWAAPAVAIRALLGEPLPELVPLEVTAEP